MELESNRDGPEEDKDVLAGPLYLDELATRNSLPNSISWKEELPLAASIQNSNAQDYVRGLVSDKAKAEKAIVKQLLNEIVLRENIRRDSLRTIEEDLCQVENSLHEIRAIIEGSYLPMHEDLRFGSRRTTLEMKMLDLNELKRRQEVDAWKDVSTLRRYLLFSLRDYWAAARRNQLLRFGLESRTKDEDVAAGS